MREGGGRRSLFCKLKFVTYGGVKVSHASHCGENIILHLPKVL